MRSIASLCRPAAGRLDLEATIAETLRTLMQRYRIVQVLYDPWQMEAMAQQLRRERVPMEKFPQTPANLTGAAQNLLELINAKNIVLYADADMRLAASRVIASEMPTRGTWKLDKSKQSHKIDVIVALAMACHSAIEGLSTSLHPSPERIRQMRDEVYAHAIGAARRCAYGGCSPGRNIYGERKWLQMQRGNGGNTTY